LGSPGWKNWKVRDAEKIFDGKSKKQENELNNINPINIVQVQIRINVDDKKATVGE